MSDELNLGPPPEQPPQLGQKCLSWSLPEEIKEPVIGDLEEAFYDKLSANGTSNAKAWYLRQAILTTLTYLRRTQTGVIMFIFSVVFFLAIVLMAMILGGDFSMYINIPSLLIVVPPSLFFAFAATSKQSVRNGLRVMFDDKLELSKQELLSAKRMYSTLGNTAMWTGFIGVIIGAIAIASNIQTDIFHKVIGPALAVCLLTLFYATVLKIPCYLAEQKIQFKIDNLS